MKNSIPLKKGLFTSSPEKETLIGNKCASCGQVFFPKRDKCLNCLGEEMNEMPLATTGKLCTYTIVNMPAHKYKPPFAIGWIDLPEGIRVFTQIKDWDKGDLKVGMDMELLIDPLWEEDDKEVTGYKFRPVR